MSLDRTLQRIWYDRSPFALFLLLTPLSLIFALIASLRRAAFQTGLLKVRRLPCPVVVVGNISVGGTGKTPLVIHLARLAARQGCRVGIVTRGYGGAARVWPQCVTSGSSAADVGDEAVLLASRTDAIVIAGPDRVASAIRAIEQGADVIISDDGLQHYELARDAEIVVVDAARGYGNGWLLPAGPLREPPSRIRGADLLVRTVRGDAAEEQANTIDAHHGLGNAINLKTGETAVLESFAGRHVHAVAGIGNPDAFFRMLSARGLDVVPHALADHAAIRAEDVTFADAAAVLMTEKDAVKCRTFANLEHWMVPLEVRFSAGDERKLAALVDSVISKPGTAFQGDQR